jgi:hypothetical protein
LSVDTLTKSCRWARHSVSETVPGKYSARFAVSIASENEPILGRALKLNAWICGALRFLKVAYGLLKVQTKVNRVRVPLTAQHLGFK